MRVVDAGERQNVGTHAMGLQRCRKQIGGAKRKVIFNLHLMFRVYFAGFGEKLLSVDALGTVGPRDSTRHNFIKSALSVARQ